MDTPLLERWDRLAKMLCRKHLLPRMTENGILIQLLLGQGGGYIRLLNVYLRIYY